MIVWLKFHKKSHNPFCNPHEPFFCECAQTQSAYIVPLVSDDAVRRKLCFPLSYASDVQNKFPFCIFLKCKHHYANYNVVFLLTGFKPECDESYNAGLGRATAQEFGGVESWTDGEAFWCAMWLCSGWCDV